MAFMIISHILMTLILGVTLLREIRCLSLQGVDTEFCRWSCFQVHLREGCIPFVNLFNELDEDFQGENNKGPINAYITYFWSNSHHFILEA